MPYDRTEPAAWWHGAEAAPPESAAPICGGTINNLPLLGTLLPVPVSPLIGVCVGDRMRHQNGFTGTVLALGPEPGEVSIRYDACRADFVWPAADIGRAGSGKPWTLLPPDPASAANAGLGGLRVVDLPPPAPASPALIKAAVERAMGVVPDSQREAREAAVRTLERQGYTYHGGEQWKPPLGPVPDFARLDVENARQEVLERVAEAARDATNPPLGDLAGSYVRLCAALRALAALDAGDG